MMTGSLRNTLTGDTITSSGIIPVQKKKNGEVENISYSPEKIDINPILINDLQFNRVFLMTKTGEVLYEWPLGDKKLGNDAFLLPDGRLLTSLRAPKNRIFLGGLGWVIQILDTTGWVLWEYTLSDANMISHHDLEMLPNGNILAMVWDRMEGSSAQANGYKMNVEIFPERIIEIDPKKNTIVWEWRSMDHIIQDVNPKLPNYGKVENRPERIDINYSQSLSGMVMHANGISYDPEQKLIYMSVYNFSEVWVIDHSTTTEEARTSRGWRYNRGGDLVYRFGNPSAYKGRGERLFYSVHHPNLLGSGKILLFSNGNGASVTGSTAYELQLPLELDQGQSTQKLPEVLWSYSHPELSFDKVGWVEKLPNRNILITEGDGTLWEVTREKELVWKYAQKPGFFWRTYSYSYDSESIGALWFSK
jgi:Arylsulfotransferase (ASST)